MVNSEDIKAKKESNLSDARVQGWASVSDDIPSGLCLTLTKDKAFSLLYRLISGANPQRNESGTSSENLVAHAVKLRKEGKSTASVATILRQKRLQSKKTGGLGRRGCM